MRLRRKDRKGIETDPILFGAVLVIGIFLAGMGIMNSFQAYVRFTESQAKVNMERIVDKMALNTLAGEGIMTDVRIKRNVYVFKNGASSVGVYSYKEIFETIPGTNQISSSPVVKFDRFYEIPLSVKNDVSIRFLPGSKPDIDKVDKVAIEVNAPNNDLKAYSVDSSFREMTPTEMNMVGSDDKRTRVYRTSEARIGEPNAPFFKGDAANSVEYGRPAGSCVPPSCSEYPTLEIGLAYKKDVVGFLDLDSRAKKMKFVREDVQIPEKYDTAIHCTKGTDGICHDNYEYDATNSCTYGFGICHPNGSQGVIQGTGVSCIWNSGTCE